MRANIIKCDNCETQTDDLLDEIGWIVIDSPSSMSVTGGRKEDGCADSLRYFSCVGELHFCCWECLLGYLFVFPGKFNTAVTLEEKLGQLDSKKRKKKIKRLYDSLSYTIQKVVLPDV